jgi:D-isomer specific 2-hydroxyacid dehydrogenase, NAD binding domain
MRVSSNFFSGTACHQFCTSGIARAKARPGRELTNRRSPRGAPIFGSAPFETARNEAVPKGVTICNVFGHEPAIAEYVLMTMLVLTHRLFESVMAFRMGSWVASPQFGGGSPHGEVLGRTIGIIGYGRIGREVAERAAGLKCRVLAANRRPVADPTPSETVFPLTDLDRMRPLCDTILIACALAPETAGLIDARRLALTKPGTLLINARRARLPSARRRSPPAAIGQPTTGAPGSRATPRRRA